MRDAAVGFQCPSCIAEGAKSVRANRTAYGGLRPTDASRTSIVLIAINVAVWLAVMVTGGAGSRLLGLISLTPRGVCETTNGNGYYPNVPEAACSIRGTRWVDGVSDGAYWQLITSVFAHEQVLHIGFNMLALWVLGPQLELAIGRARFLALYLLSGLAGSALVYWAAPETQSTLGASGAIFGLMGALLVIALKVRANVQGLLMWIGINAVFTLVGSNISWQGHLGGFIGGIVIAAILVYSPKERRTAVQVSGLSLIAVGLVVAIIARTAVLA
ncbi:rhomboid family intramembrane serine protease [Nocardioides sp.]|uniref:rhomboid family intramembrane serine protease n=1 Tax=Nocardioides sp. TaxID=35761 RepID=UPI0031FF1255|nr:rhomboid family intrarane serine protease [Nocardioides sp.]